MTSENALIFETKFIRNGEDAKSILMLFPSEELKELLIKKSKTVTSYPAYLFFNYASTKIFDFLMDNNFIKPLSKLEYSKQIITQKGIDAITKYTGIENYLKHKT